MTIAPIETRYAGCRFRSRLEARWAVALDHLGIQWEYEQQGYTLPSGARYLPDFRLPELKIFLEIKGAPPGVRDTAKIREFAVASREHGYVTLLLIGDVPRPQQSNTHIPARSFLVRKDGVHAVNTSWKPAPGHRIRAALTAARSARFEFGESG